MSKNLKINETVYNNVDSINMSTSDGDIAEFIDVDDVMEHLPDLSNFGNATAATVLSGNTFTSVAGVKVTGSMANQGAKTVSLNCGGTYTIPAGYHNGSGKVTANSLASQTDGTATATQILSGATAYVDGAKVTGTMTNRGAVSSTLNAGGSYTIPAGYHNGSGKVTANSLASQTSATAAAADIAKGKTAWVNGSKVTGIYEGTNIELYEYSGSPSGTTKLTIPNGFEANAGTISVCGWIWCTGVYGYGGMSILNSVVVADMDIGEGGATLGITVDSNYVYLSLPSSIEDVAEVELLFIREY